MLNVSKLNKCKRLSKCQTKKIEIYFFFYFKKIDLYYWKYNGNDEIRHASGGRVDRPNEIMKYAYLSRNILCKV